MDDDLIYVMNNATIVAPSGTDSETPSGYRVFAKEKNKLTIKMINMKNLRKKLLTDLSLKSVLIRDVT